MFYIALVIILLVLTVFAIFVPRMPAVLSAYAAVWVCQGAGTDWFSTGFLVFWGVATVIALGITTLVPDEVSSSRVGVPYMGGGALAGTVVGMLSNTMAGIIVGAAAGVLLGGIAFANTAAGRAVMHFPSAPFFNYLAAKGLPVVVALSMAAACVVHMLAAV